MAYLFFLIVIFSGSAFAIEDTRPPAQCAGSQTSAFGTEYGNCNASPAWGPGCYTVNTGTQDCVITKQGMSYYCETCVPPTCPSGQHLNQFGECTDDCYELAGDPTDKFCVPLSDNCQHGQSITASRSTNYGNCEVRGTCDRTQIWTNLDTGRQLTCTTNNHYTGQNASGGTGTSGSTPPNLGQDRDGDGEPDPDPNNPNPDPPPPPPPPPDPPGTANSGPGCEAEPSCSGDEIQCAILKEQWRTRCGIGHTTSGGGGCEAAPMCTGDPIMCQIQFQAWKTRCAAEAAADGSIAQLCKDKPDLKICKTSATGNDISDFCAIKPNAAICKEGAAGNMVSEFCEQNPQALLCTDALEESVTGGDACDAPPTCTGKAVECATLVQTWKAACNSAKALTGDGSGGEGRSVGGVACGSEPPECKGDVFQCAIIKQQWLSRCSNTDTTGTELGSALDGTDPKSASKAKENGDTNNLDLSTRLNTGGFLGRACPANQSFQVLDVNVTLPFADICFALEIMGNVALAMAMLMAARIVFV